MADVKGVRHNVFYINHSRAEERDEETKSYSNVHEASYLVALCGYLLKQGYRRSQITILTPYSGQVMMMVVLLMMMMMMMMIMTDVSKSLSTCIFWNDDDDSDRCVQVAIYVHVLDRCR